jgi:hypothetical protein
MNNERRKELDKAFGLIEEAASIIENVRDEEQEAFDNLSENFQNGDKGTAMSEKICELTEAYDACDNIKASIETAKE